MGEVRSVDKTYTLEIRNTEVEHDRNNRKRDVSVLILVC